MTHVYLFLKAGSVLCVEYLEKLIFEDGGQVHISWTTTCLISTTNAFIIIYFLDFEVFKYKVLKNLYTIIVSQPWNWPNISWSRAGPLPCPSFLGYVWLLRTHAWLFSNGIGQSILCHDYKNIGQWNNSYILLWIKYFLLRKFLWFKCSMNRLQWT